MAVPMGVTIAEHTDEIKKNNGAQSTKVDQDQNMEI